MIVHLNLLWSEFVETMRRFDLLLQILVTHRLYVCDLTQIPTERSGCRWGQLVSLITIHGRIRCVHNQVLCRTIASDDLSTRYHLRAVRTTSSGCCSQHSCRCSRRLVRESLYTSLGRRTSTDRETFTSTVSYHSIPFTAN